MKKTILFIESISDNVFYYVVKSKVHAEDILGEIIFIFNNVKRKREWMFFISEPEILKQVQMKEIYEKLKSLNESETTNDIAKLPIALIKKIKNKEFKNGI